MVPQCRSGQVQKISPAQAFDCRILHSAVSFYTICYTPGPTILRDIKKDRQSAYNITYSWFRATNGVVE